MVVSQIVKDKIEESLSNWDIVQIKVLNGNKHFFYKGFFIKSDYKNNLVSFYDVIKEKIIITISDIHEIVTITKEGAKLISAWEKYNG